MNAIVEAARLLADALPCHSALELTGGVGQARIVLGDQVYTLRITRAGKLILTK
jgi:hemin uptake protein HemP